MVYIGVICFTVSLITAKISGNTSTWCYFSLLIIYLQFKCQHSLFSGDLHLTYFFHSQITQSGLDIDTKTFTFLLQLSTRLFHGKKPIVVVPANPTISDDEGSEEDDDVADPDFMPFSHSMDTPCPSDTGPSAKRKCVRLAVEELEDEEDDDDNDENEDEDQPAPQAKGRKKGKTAARITTWKKVDVDNQALPEYHHMPPDFIETPYSYFSRYFSPHVINHITYQTNLYATQKDVNTTFTTTEDEMTTFVAILLYMGIYELPSIDDYWAMETRVPQVANLMSSKRFRLMRRLLSTSTVPP